uniref:Uncharacterized protein n=1 Tax=Setaria italica TaxID=4555 RepID=A0A0Q3S8A3_SETIT
MVKTTTHKALSIVVLLLKVDSLSSLVLKLNLPFALILMRLEVPLVHCTTWALEPPSLPRTRESFAL